MEANKQRVYRDNGIQPRIFHATCCTRYTLSRPLFVFHRTAPRLNRGLKPGGGLEAWGMQSTPSRQSVGSESEGEANLTMVDALSMGQSLFA